jgi:uncharacterized protein involved in response to NO
VTTVVSNERAIWVPYMRLAVGLALTAGFGFGGFLFAAGALGLPTGAWWAATAQAHGHIQLFGWVGLPVCGIGWHFLPRLRGAPHADPHRTMLALGLLTLGLLGRTVAQPALAAGGAAATVWRVLLLGSGTLELAGATLVLAAVARLPRQGPPLATRDSFRAIWPLALAAFSSCWLALALNLAGLVGLALSGATLVAAPFDRATIDLALYGFLLPMAVAMSARLFPLYFRTPPVAPRALRAGLALTGAGLALRLGGDSGQQALVAGLGRLLQVGGLILFVLALGIFARRRPSPRAVRRLATDPAHLHTLTAYAWFLIGTALVGWQGLALLVPGLPAAPDGERHALGAGYFTVLILGIGTRLLPGFARRPLRREGFCWATLVLANGAALLRVGLPLLPPVVPVPLADGALAAAGWSPGRRRALQHGRRRAFRVQPHGRRAASQGAGRLAPSSPRPEACGTRQPHHLTSCSTQSAAISRPSSPLLFTLR